MKKLFLFAAAAALLAACSSKDDLSTGQQPAAATDDGAVSFEAYTGRAATRGGVPGVLTTSTSDATKISLQEKGFGVFGYYTDNNDYDQRATPDFFYNQKVAYESSSWKYSPLKYWPNEYGTNAESEDADKVTYFAYAPWINVVPTSGKVVGADADKSLEQWGIVGMTRNSTQGDPILKYIASFAANKSVDLCWGVADNGDGNWLATNPENNQVIEDGKPWLNVYRPAKTEQKVKFTFKHALAQMRMTIDADVDVDGHGHSKVLTNKTRIWVREVKFNGFVMKGALNLNNDDDAFKPKWLDFNGQNEMVSEAVTVYDGRKDGKEGVLGAVATNEKTLGLNPTLIQDDVYEGITDKDKPYKANEDIYVCGVDAAGNRNTDTEYKRTGVTKTTVNLFAQGAENKSETDLVTNATAGIFHVIPTDEAFEVEIVYDVETVSENLPLNLSDGQTKGTTIENRIRKSVKFGNANKLQAGHSYTLNLHLGMYSVKFDAAVSDWITEDPQDVDLPLNVPSFEAGATETVDLPYKGDYTFAMTGMSGGETVTYAVGTPTLGWTATENAADASGVSIQTIYVPVNNNTTIKQHQGTWKGDISGDASKITLNFNQAAHPLFLTATGTANQTTITLTRNNSAAHDSQSDWGSQTTGWLAEDAAGNDGYIRVWRNGIELNHAASITNGNDFTFIDTGAAAQTNTVTIKDKLVKDDAITIELKTGDAPVETVNFVVE